MPVPIRHPSTMGTMQPSISLTGGRKDIFPTSIFFFSLLRSRHWCRISLIANRPIIKAVEFSPFINCQLPKVRRCTPEIESMPKLPSTMPISAPTRPLSRSLDAMVMTTARPTRATAKYSQLPKIRETLDNCGARKNRARAETVPPIREAKTPIDSAVPGLPLLAMG